MGIGHTQDQRDDRTVRVPSRTRNALVVVLVPMVLALAAGMALLWPGPVELTGSAGADERYEATVVQVRDVPCEGTDPELDIECSVSSIELREGPDDGEIVELPESSDIGAPLDEGDRIVVTYAADAPEGLQYTYQDRERRQPLLIFGAVFAVAVIAIGRLKGVGALVSIGVSLIVLATFVLPAILEGSDPVLVALVGGGVIAVLAVYVSHGIDARTTTALVGALGSLALLGGLAWVAIELSDLSGLADERVRSLQLAASHVQLEGLILAGVVIGTIGLLGDVTVTQASAVWDLRRANPALDRSSLFGAALRTGRDHLASTLNTLVLAYAGASLPLLLLFTAAQQGVADVAITEVVAIEIVRTLIGSIGLVAAVPIATALAVLAVGRPEGTARTGGFNDPREHRSRHERWMWGE